MESVSDKSRENQNTDFVVIIFFFFENHAGYGIIRKIW